MVVRSAEREDRPQLVELIKGYFAFYRTPFPAESKIGALLDLLERDPSRGVQLVADAGGRLQGFASLYGCFDTLVADRILVMNDLFVDPSFRNGGVGAALFDACLAYATAHGYARLDWVTATDNQDAQRFYDRQGGRRGPWVSYSADPTDRIER
ncbi:MAG TPA: GNAT family N-acetyltransferase [Candidatus Dormibacteraeota bacterium]|nr:GNAT family N-acetyltransferase [Candidatus Dormibacteraeota bacterium]